MAKLFALIHWEDNVRGVIDMINIVEPRKAISAYKEGELISARYSRGGVYRAIISEIGDDRSVLEKRKKEKLKHQYPDGGTGESETGSERKDEAERKPSSPETEHTSQATPKRRPRPRVPKPLPALKFPSDDDDSFEDSGSDAEYLPSKKKKVCDDTDVRAKQAKQLLNTKRNDQSKARALVNKEVSMDILQDDACSAKKIETLTARVTHLEGLVKAMINGQFALSRDVRQMLKGTQCKSCMKLMYKKAVMSSDGESSHPRPMDLDPTVDPPTSPVLGASAVVDTHREDNKETSCTVPASQSTNDGVSTTDSDELAYLGNAKYGIKIDRMGLNRCIACAKGDGTKFALHCLEFLVNFNECADLTMYGQGRGKKAMDENKRKALRSQIFTSFCANWQESDKEKLWNDIVPKLNNKIRGIKNNKYKSK